MRNWQRKSIVLAIIGALLVGVGGAPVLAQEGYDFEETEVTAGTIVFDFALLRPMGAIATVLGAGIYVISLPISGPMGNHDQVAQKLVVDPYRFTLDRPLGQMP